MKRLAMGAALGGFAVYLFDPELGEERRERLLSHWREYRGSAVQTGRAAFQAAESARPLARRITKAAGRGGWAEAFNRRRPAVGLPKLIGAAAIGGVLVYFLDPVHGSERRQWLLSYLEAAGRQAARQKDEAVKPQADRVSDEVADSVEGIKSKIR
jgi:gas vesicle protein